MRILILLIVFFASPVFSQQSKIALVCDVQPLEKVLNIVESKYNIVFSYSDPLIKNRAISLPQKERNIQEVLDEMKTLSGLQFDLYQNRYVVISSKVQKESQNEFNVGIQDLNVVVVNGYLSKGIKKMASGGYNIMPKNIEILPGLTEFDALESIQMLPGNFSPNETAANFFVRGGYSDQNRLIWDGINLYHKGHLFGMISPINPNIINDIQFYNKGTNARYGERLSSVIDIRTSHKIADSLTVESGFNGINADVILNAPMLKNKLSAQASFRTNYFGKINTITSYQLKKKVFDNSQHSLSNVDYPFSFLDANLKINYKLNQKNEIQVSAITIENGLDNSESITSENQEMTIKNVGYSLFFKRLWKKNLTQKVAGFFSDYDFSYVSTKTDSTENRSEFEKRNVIYDSGISTEFALNNFKNKVYTFGYQYNLKDVAYAFLSDSKVNIILNQDKQVLQNHSIYGSLDYISNFADISVGLRNSYFQEFNKIRFEPRLIITKPISKRIKLQLSGEIKNQVISEIDETVLSDISLENRVWRLANDEQFPIMNSHQLTFGGMYKRKGYHIDIDTYYKKLSNITALSLGFLNPSSLNFNLGNQNTFGVDLFARKKFGAFSTWFSYTLNASKNRFESLNNADSFKSRTSITHLLATSVSYQKNEFNLSIGWRLNTGRPFTFSEVNEDGELEFNDGINTGRLPVFHRLDLSSTYDFNFNSSGKTKGKFGFSIRNFYNQKNLISREYSGNNSLDDPIRVVDKYGIGITPNLMFRVYW